MPVFRYVRGLVFVLAAVVLTVGIAVGARQKRLIEFGWDEPDAVFLHRYSRQMQQTPFDGCVYHLNYGSGSGMSQNFAWECWGKRLFHKSEFATALGDLKTSSLGRFRHNFLRFNIAPGDVDWFDDFSPVLANARLAGEIANESRSDGILFDVEHYLKPVFNYTEQRGYPARTWDDYAFQARKRGHQIMRAFQQNFPAIRVFLTFGYEVPWIESNNGARPLRECAYGLLVPFLNGMLDGANHRARLIDGHESAYAFRQASDFVAARRQMSTDVLPIVSNAELYRHVFSFSFGIWLDGNWRSTGWSTKDFSHNFHDPTEFESITRAALQQADEYVWIYSEKPRWWTAPDGATTDLPEAYQKALVGAAKPTRSVETGQPTLKHRPPQH